jgi:vacuolar iron transporter family protein
MAPDEAVDHARTVLTSLEAYAGSGALVVPASGDAPETDGASGQAEAPVETPDEHETIGTALGAAVASFCFFASGAAIPVLPYLLGATGWTAVAWSAGLVGIALLGTGAVVGLLSGTSPAGRALRQLAIGWGAAAATYLLGLVFGTTVP